MITLDILLPYYGNPALMRIAVESVLSQDDPDWRLLILDDAYPDAQIARWLNNLRDDRISFERAPENLGVNRAFQALLERSSADFVTFFGCDDVMLPQYVGTMRSLAAQFPRAAIIQPGVRVIDLDGRPSLGAADRVKSLLRPRPHFPAELVGGERLAASLLVGNWTYFPSIAWKRNCIADRGFREGLSVVLDLDLLFDVVTRGGEMLLAKEVLFEYRRHNSSVSSLMAIDGRRFIEEMEFFRRARHRSNNLGWPLASAAAIFHPTSRLHAALLVLSKARRQIRRTKPR